MTYKFIFFVSLFLSLSAWSQTEISCQGSWNKDNHMNVTLENDLVLRVTLFTPQTSAKTYIVKYFVTIEDSDIYNVIDEKVFFEIKYDVIELRGGHAFFNKDRYYCKAPTDIKN